MTATSVGTLRAVVFDVDGTLAETERDGHRIAFNHAFRDHGLADQWTIGEYGELLRITGGRRRLAHYLRAQGRPDAEAESLAVALHARKTEYFTDWLRTGHLQARPGVSALMRQLLDLDVALAIATTGSAAWVYPLLERLFGGVPLAPIITGDDVTALKPHPEAYLAAIERLGVHAADALAVEDSPAGLEAARAAGLPCIVVTSAYTRRDRFPGAAAVVPGYLAVDQFNAPSRGELNGGLTGAALVRLHARLRRAG